MHGQHYSVCHLYDDVGHYVSTAARPHFFAVSTSHTCIQPHAPTLCTILLNGLSKPCVSTDLKEGTRPHPQSGACASRTARPGALALARCQHCISLFGLGQRLCELLSGVVGRDVT